MATKILHQLEPWSQLDGKIIMVTGASSGLGLDLAKAGCRVVAAARRADRLKSLCDQINASAGGSNGGPCRAIAVELDVTADGPAIAASVEKGGAFGHIDALINNAGVRGQVKSSLELSEEEWNSVVKTNLTGSWLVSKFVGERLRCAGRGGSIINISSISGLSRAQLRGGVAYSSSKAGLDSMTKETQDTMAQQGRMIEQQQRMLDEQQRMLLRIRCHVPGFDDDEDDGSDPPPP